jgi:NADPH-dependent 2,4-dienoyl-CoA reductase/sulfur reductase-like enzyme
MEAALTAAKRGHEVILAEKEERVGGQMRVAAVPPDKGEIKEFADYQRRQLKKSGIEIRCGSKITTGNVESLKPDAVVLATGVSPVRPEIPGAERAHVVSAVDVLAGRGETGQNVLVLGGGLVGCETARYLAAEGRNVTVIEILERLASDMLPEGRELEVNKLRLAGIGIQTQMAATEITPKGVKTTRNGKPYFFEADTVVVAVGMVPDNALSRELKNVGVTPQVIGDAAQPGKIIDAVYSGARVGREI